MRKPTPPSTVLALLPIAVRTRVEELIGSLTKTSGSHVESIIAFGSVVRGGYEVERSDVDIALVLKSDSPEILEAMAPALRLARAAARIEVVILTSTEIARGADVFPLWFDDMRGCHSVLWGKDSLVDVVIHDEHKRLRIEQELRDARLRLRQVIVTGSLSDALLGAALARMTHQLRSPLHALLLLKGKSVKDDVDTVLRVAGAMWHADPASLLSPQRDPRATLRALRSLLDEAVADADALAVPGGAA